MPVPANEDMGCSIQMSSSMEKPNAEGDEPRSDGHFFEALGNFEETMSKGAAKANTGVTEVSSADRMTAKMKARYCACKFLEKAFLRIFSMMPKLTY